jgi:7-cyano-7-deazaguanine synthase
MSKADIVRKAEELGLPFEQTWSCYAGGDRPCDECESCMIRKRGFEEAGLKDPLRE